MLTVLGFSLVCFSLIGFLAMWLARPFEWDHPGYAYASWLLWSLSGIGVVFLAFGMHP